MGDIAIDYAQTTIQEAVQKALDSATTIVSDTNKSLILGYGEQFQAWAVRFRNGTDTLAGMPKPPLALEVIYAPDATTGPGSEGPYQKEAVLWPSYAVSDKPVCDPLPVPPDIALHLSVSQAKIGPKIPGLVRDGHQCYQKLDATTSTVTVPGVSSDGDAGFFAPRFLMAALGWYEKVG